MCRGLVEISSGDDAFRSRVSAVGTLIRQHQRIIALSGDIETLFSYIALMQFLWNTLVICSLGFVIVTVSNASRCTAQASERTSQLMCLLHTKKFHSHSSICHVLRVFHKFMYPQICKFIMIIRFARDMLEIPVSIINQEY